ncbi:tail fiber protein [Hoeflea sp. YIM 152468]|uniref:phage tail protein n=1 Tax=Hoeflea sp. YIM 152468 TaxID=3031759 RepID=UPI0023DBB836|nr:tail fiber protein [Hoeflea sp. YIM 152468]MDF1606912.1 tail fiber protein [Hoeflea sp. YIM 152468]
MSEPFVGEIRMFAGNFAPRGWAFCDGQLLAVSQNDALFSLLGTIYGGDGRTTFGLPDMRGRLPIHAGHGPGLSERRLGAKGGAETVTLTVNQLASHTHQMQASASLGNSPDPVTRVVGRAASFFVYRPQEADGNMATSAITQVGGSRSHTNLMPYLCINYIIALFGIYPSRH